MSGTYSMCPLKFYLSYVLGYDEPPNIKTCMGTIVHKVMEILAKVKLAQQNGKSSVEDEVTGRFYLKKFDLNILVEKVYQYYAKAFTNHEWTDEQYNTVKLWVKKTIEFNDGEYDPRNQDIVAPENNFNYTLEDPDLDGINLCGTIDLVTRSDANTYHIIDYKTGKRVNWGTGKTKEYSDLMDDFQLNFYHIAARMLYPQIDNILITIFFINDGGPYTIPFGRCDVPKAIDNVKKLYNQITTKEPEVRRGFWCRFCSFSKTSFEGTNVLPIINTGQQGAYFKPPIGQALCKCDQTNYTLKRRPIDLVTEKMKRENFDNTAYKPPGEVVK